MPRHAYPHRTSRHTTPRRRGLLFGLLVTLATGWAPLAAQHHEHGAATEAHDPRLELVLGGPHLILYHRGYLTLGDTQVIALERLRRTVCDAARVYADRTTEVRARLRALLAEASPPPLHEPLGALATAEGAWLTALLEARRDALALLAEPQRALLSTLMDHWLRESVAMIDEATRPGQRGHPGVQLPIRVPGMVVAETTLVPHCESLHGPARHIVIPSPP